MIHVPSQMILVSGDLGSSVRYCTMSMTNSLFMPRSAYWQKKHLLPLMVNRKNCVLTPCDSGLIAIVPEDLMPFATKPVLIRENHQYRQNCEKNLLRYAKNIPNGKPFVYSKQ